MFKLFSLVHLSIPPVGCLLVRLIRGIGILPKEGISCDPEIELRLAGQHVSQTEVF